MWIMLAVATQIGYAFYEWEIVQSHHTANVGPKPNFLNPWVSFLSLIPYYNILCFNTQTENCIESYISKYLHAHCV